jgi:dsRNA-specific ribonuclease
MSGARGKKAILADAVEAVIGALYSTPAIESPSSSCSPS